MSAIGPLFGVLIAALVAISAINLAPSVKRAHNLGQMVDYEPPNRLLDRI